MMNWLRVYKRQEKAGYCCVCGSRTNMMVEGDNYLCSGYGMGGLDPSSTAFCHNIYTERKSKGLI